GRGGRRVVVGREPVTQIVRERSTVEFVRRYLRWTVIHRKMVARAAYAGELLLNPTALAALACALAPSRAALALVAAKVAVDALVARLLRGRALRPAALLVLPLKDLLLAAVWARCLFSDTVA